MRPHPLALMLSGATALFIHTLAAGQAIAAQPHDDKHPSSPASLQAEHRELHSVLEALLHAGGKTGAAAEKVSQALRPHFIREEKFALPPLSALDALSHDREVQGASALIVMAQQLKRERASMLEEHSHIRKTLEQLRNAALEERQSKGVEFADKLRTHANMEEIGRAHV